LGRQDSLNSYGTQVAHSPTVPEERRMVATGFKRFVGVGPGPAHLKE
jgi:hypothetical protein